MMKVTPLITHWRPEDAREMIEFLDHLRDALCATYGEEIARQQRGKLTIRATAGADRASENDEGKSAF